MEGDQMSEQESNENTEESSQEEMTLEDIVSQKAQKGEEVVVEVICTGNSGRSPQGETYGNNYVKEKGLDKKIKFVSSGTGVESIEEMTLSEKDQLLYIKIAHEHGAFKGEAKAVADEILSRNNTDTKTIKSYAVHAMKALEYEEHMHRDNVLFSYGLVLDPNFKSKQTIASSEVTIVLPMKQSNADQAKEIYNKAGLHPHIEPLNSFADLPGDIPDPFGGNYETFAKSGAAIKKAVELSVDKIVELYVK